MKKIIIVSIVAITLSILALCISLFRCSPITYDWMGVLVGILALLTTVLLGWQIYSVINLEQLKNSLQTKMLSIEKEKIISMISVNSAMFTYYYKTGDVYEGYKYAIFVTKGFSSLNEYEKAAIMVKSAIEIAPKEFSLSHFHKSTLLSLFYGVPHADKIRGMNELEKILFNIKVTGDNNETFLSYRDNFTPRL